MGMMIVTDEEFESQLTKVTPVSVIKDIKIGRGHVKEVPVEIKKVISEESIKGAPAKELSDIFNVSPSSISAYKNDATSTSTYNEPNKELAQANRLVRNDITDKARTRLLDALEGITPEKLKDASLKVASAVAKDMSCIIKNMEPEKEAGDVHNTQFIYYAPPMKQEADYEIVSVPV